jgi:hypothetical protein
MGTTKRTTAPAVASLHCFLSGWSNPFLWSDQSESTGSEQLERTVDVQQIKAIALTRGFLSIQQAGTTVRKWNVQASKIPNINLCMTLVNSIVNCGRG